MIYVKTILAMVCLMAFLALLLTCSLVLSGCTISFQNISTHGTATDLVDENQAASPTVTNSMPGVLPVF